MVHTGPAAPDHEIKSDHFILVISSYNWVITVGSYVWYNVVLPMKLLDFTINLVSWLLHDLPIYIPNSLEIKLYWRKLNWKQQKSLKVVLLYKSLPRRNDEKSAARAI